MAASIQRFIRIHPYAPKKGYRVKTYNVLGTPFFEERGWYQISLRPDQFQLLSMIRTEPENPDAKPVFDICTEEEKLRMEQDEKRMAEPHADQPSFINLDKTERDARYLEDASRGRTQSVDLTTADLRRAPENVVAERDFDEIRDLAPPTPVITGAIDGAVPSGKRRGRPPGSGKAKTAPVTKPSPTDPDA